VAKRNGQSRFAFQLCPQCGSKNVGRIAKQTYFCRDCFTEIVEKKQGQLSERLTLLEILEDGSVQAIGDV